MKSFQRETIVVSLCLSRLRLFISSDLLLQKFCFLFFCFLSSSTSLSSPGYATMSIHKRSATHSHECVARSCVQTMVWLPVFAIFSMRTDADACDCTRDCTSTAREPSLEVDSGRKIPCRTWDSNPRSQYCVSRFSRTLNKLNYPPILAASTLSTIALPSMFPSGD